MDHSADGVMKRNRVDLTDSYYGYQCEADGVLLPIETLAEKDFRQKLFSEWQRKKLKRRAPSDTANDDTNAEEPERNIYDTGENPADTERDTIYDDLKRSLGASSGMEMVTELECRVKRFTNVNVPSQSEVRHRHCRRQSLSSLLSRRRSSAPSST